MAAPVLVSHVGNELHVQYDNGSVHRFVPIPNGMWMPAKGFGPATGSGGEGPDVPATGGTPGTVAAAVDDYPWPRAPQDDLSPLRYSYRDCTDFAAWRINRDRGCTSAPWRYTWAQLRLVNGNAIGWRQDWLSHGWGVSTTPFAGAIAWYGSKVGTFGHVAYVQQVASGNHLHIEQYNWGAKKQAYSTMDADPGDANYPDAFLSLPPA